MKVIDMNEAKANLEQYARDCHESPVIVTIGGKPTFEMIPIHTDDPEFIDRLLEEDEAFRRSAIERRRGPCRDPCWSTPAARPFILGKRSSGDLR